jgi:tRNA G18 (ribose-2'-O)-methylase SpoU
MTKPLVYSSTKFLSFPPEKQFAAFNKLVSALESALSVEPERKRLIEHLLELRLLAAEPLPDKLNLLLRELHPKLSPHQILNKLFIYHEGALRKDSQLAIRTGDGHQVPDPQLRKKASKITVICDNLRSVFNVGSLFRTAECLGIGKILLCGICPTPEHGNMEKTAMGTQVLVPWEYFSTTEEAIKYCRDLNYKIYALETLAEAQSVFAASYELPLALLIGNESLGIEPKLLPLCDAYLSLPQLGWKNSLNVGVAAAITLYNIMFGA